MRIEFPIIPHQLIAVWHDGNRILPAPRDTVSCPIVIYVNSLSYFALTQLVEVGGIEDEEEEEYPPLDEGTFPTWLIILLIVMFVLLGFGAIIWKYR
jgi:hypothetical protein